MVIIYFIFTFIMGVYCVISLKFTAQKEDELNLGKSARKKSVGSFK